MYNTKQYQNYNLKIIVNKKLKHSYIRIDKNKNILVKTPYSSKTFVYSLLEEKEAWIQKQFLKIDNFTIIKDTEVHSKEFIESRVTHFSNLMELEFNKLRFRKMKSMWGSCNSKKEITLNSELSRLNKNLIDYVVVHELAHLIHMNHSSCFHNLVDRHLPDSKFLRKELKNISLFF